jgi:hypothetical protein
MRVSTVLGIRFTTRVLGFVVLLLSMACGPARPVGAPLPQPVAAPLLPSASAPADVVFVIPPETYAAELRGEPVFAVPNEIQLIVGQSITVRNDDHAMHYFFDIPIAPGQSVRKTFNQTGRYGYNPGLSCSIVRDGSVSVVVSDR